MVQNSKTVLIFATLVVAVIFQLLFIAADCRDTPVKAAVEFSKNYFLLKETMADRLCDELTTDEENDVVKVAIITAGEEAGARGFELGMVKKSLSHIETETLHQDDKTARIKLTANSRVSINPVFAWVATLFKLGETQHVQTVFSLVKEDGGWKVCGNPFGMSDAEI